MDLKWTKKDFHAGNAAELVCFLQKNLLLLLKLSELRFVNTVTTASKECSKSSLKWDVKNNQKSFMKVLSVMDVECVQSKESATCAQYAPISTFVNHAKQVEHIANIPCLRSESLNLLQLNSSASTRMSKWTNLFHLKSALWNKIHLYKKKFPQQSQRIQDIKLALLKRVSSTSMKFHLVLNSRKHGFSEMMEKPHGRLMYNSFSPLETTLVLSQFKLVMRCKPKPTVKSLSCAKLQNKKAATLPTSECKLETSSSATRFGVIYSLWSQSKLLPWIWLLKRTRKWRKNLHSSQATSLETVSCRAKSRLHLKWRAQRCSTMKISPKSLTRYSERLWPHFMSSDSVTSRLTRPWCSSTKTSTLLLRPYATACWMKALSRTSMALKRSELTLFDHTALELQINALQTLILW